MTTLWAFSTRNFVVDLAYEDERDPDLSWADQETLDKIDSGEWINVTFRARVLGPNGETLGEDYLGNSVYEDVREFVTAHRDPEPSHRNTMAMKASGTVICHYFPDMVREAIRQARSTAAGWKRISLHA